MTAPVGSVKVTIEGDGDPLEKALQDAVADAMRDVQRKLATEVLSARVEVEGIRAEITDVLEEAQRTADANPIRISVDVDSGAAIADFATMQASLRAQAADAITQQVRVDFEQTGTPSAGLPTGSITLDVDLDTANARTQWTTLREDLSREARVQVQIDLDAAAAAGAQAIQGLVDKDVRIKVDLDLDAADLAAVQSVQAMADRDIRIGVALAMDAAQAAALREIQTMADKDVRVKVDIDLDATKVAALQEVRALADKDVRIKLDVDLSQTTVDRLKEAGPALRQLRSLTDKDIRIKVRLDMTDDELKRLKDVGPALRSIRTLSDKDIRLKVRLEMTQAELDRLKEIAPALRTLRGLSDKDVKIKIDIQVDEAQLQRVAALLRDLRSHTANVRVNTNADDASNSIARLHQQLRGLDTAAIGATAVAAALAGIGGAAGAAAGAIGGLVVAAAALGPAIAAGIGVAVVGMQGMKDAFDAVSDVSENSAKEAEEQAEKVTAANNQVASAERSLRSAKQAALDAEKDLTRARKEATEQLEDMHRSARTGVLDERQAVRDLNAARRDLAKANPADRDAYEEAVDAVARAEIRLDEIRDRNADNAERLADAERKGIEGSDQVVAAKQRQAQASDQVAAAEQQMATAQAALTKAQNDALPSAEKLEKALAKLSPHAQSFVLTAQQLGPAWENVRKSVQDNMFEGLDETLLHLADTVLPSLQTGMGAVATQMNLGARSFADFLSSAEGIAGLDAMFATTEGLMRGMREGSDGFLAGLSEMMQATAPFAEQIGRAFGSIGTALGDAFSQLASSGVLGEVLSGLTTMLEGVGPLLRDLIIAFAELGARVMPALGPLFEAIGSALVTIAPALGDLGAIFAESLTMIMPILADFVAELAQGLAPVLPVIASLLGVMLDALQPLIEPLAQVAVVVGSALAQAIQALAPAIGPLGEAFAALVTAVAPLVPLVAESLSAVLQALAPALTQVANALAPVIAAFADQMRPVIAQVAPILAEVAMTIGMALADAIRQIAPVLPQIATAFTNLLMAILPLLPELVRLAAELLPPLLRILVELSPVLVKLMEAFTWLVQNVLIPIVMPVIRQLADEFKTAMDRIGDVIVWVKDTLFPKLGDALETVKGWFSTGVQWIKDKWAELKENAADPIRYVVNTVWNDGLRKAWNSIAEFLPGVEPLDPVQLSFKHGGAVRGPGSGTSDSIPAWLSNNEHVIRALEVAKAGGHAVWYAIRDMIARGIPFQWDGTGRVISLLGRDNLAAYGAKVQQKGIGNVAPEGLFDPLLPRFRTGGAVVMEPWMHQLKAGHDFARAQHGKPYKWAGPAFVGDSFDCSGFMASIAAAILGQNPWQRYWATSSFAGYPPVGPQGFTKGIVDGGFVVGITDDPGGPGGGHTAGVLGAIPGYPTARVESSGSGGVQYGNGPDPRSFASVYGLPIGANGFFQPGTGSSGSIGPTPDQQRNFIQRRIVDIVDRVLDPIEDTMSTVIGPPPPRWKEIPPAALRAFEAVTVKALTDATANLSDLLPVAWEGAQRVIAGIGDSAGRALDVLNPFRRQRGGVIPGAGTGDIVPALLEPGEIVMNRRAAAAFGPLLLGLNRAVPRFQTGGEVGGSVAGLLGGIAAGAIPVRVVNFGDLTTDTGTGGMPAAVQSGMESAAPAFVDATMGAVSSVGQQVAGDVGGAVVDALTTTPGVQAGAETLPAEQTMSAADEQTHQMLDEQGRVLTDTRDLIERTASSAEQVQIQQLQQVRDQVLEVARLLGGDVLIPVVQTAMDQALGVVQSWLNAGFAHVRQGSDQTTRAVYETGGEEAAAAAIPFGQPGSAFDAAKAISEAVVGVADAATTAFNKVAQDVANAALAQKPSRVGNSRGVLGQDISGGPLVDMIVKLTGAVIEIEETLIDTLDEVRTFRRDLLGTSDEQGRIISDTALLMQRNQSSVEKVMNEQNRINRELIKAVLRYLMTAVVIPIMTAILGAMIQLAVTALGAAIGSIIPGIGTAIGAAIGAVVGAALAGVAAVFTSTLAIGAGAAIDAFDSGGLAVGKGLLVKDTNLHERVLSPRETASYDRLGLIADHLERSRGRQIIVQSPINLSGSRATPEQVQDSLLKLMVM